MPSQPDWADTPFVKVYGTLGRDHPRIWRDDALLGAYVRALWAADRTWPAPAPIPPMEPGSLETLVAEGVIERDGGWFRFHGLDAERELQAQRGDWHRAGGRARASAAARDAAGRFGAGPAAAGGAGGLNGSHPLPSGPAAGPSAGTQHAAGTSTPAPDQNPRTRHLPYGQVTGSRGQQSAGAAGNVTQTRMRGVEGVDDPCYAVPPHPRDQRTKVQGRGWVCVACERADSRSLRERVGWSPGEPARYVGGDDDDG